jgi:hypothetical protein
LALVASFVVTAFICCGDTPGRSGKHRLCHRWGLCNAAALQQHRLSNRAVTRSFKLHFIPARTINFFQLVTRNLFIPDRSFISLPTSGYARAAL